MDTRFTKTWLITCIFYMLVGIWLIPVKGCEESCRFSYDQSFKEYSHRCDQTSTGNIVVTDRAHFDGTAFLSLPMFQQNPLRPSFSIAFIFKYLGQHTFRDVAILSNGCVDTPPTIEFKLRQERRHNELATTTLSLKMTNDDRDMNITVRNINVNVRQEVLVQIAQNETAIEVQVAGQPRQTFAKDVNDYIGRSDCPLQIGAGRGLDNYVGEFDEFVYFPCVNPGFFSISSLF
ncbi:uncharacterized protein LOC124138139 [Haliotis rufescens]|uniref:uncharacterized protein LOC124138139 n=1 Tax=Haliotis rufescens TaxID=6454 RepID=UPI00201F5345|nr:uncharacterized protein LOC124138139 [Haliotis rufescens]